MPFLRRSASETIQSISDLDHKIATLEPSVKADEERVKAIEKSNAGVSALTLEQNQALQAANTLIARKSFSWSQLLTDLERHVPDSVRVTKITMNKVGQRARTSANDPGGKTISLTLGGVAKNIGAVTQIVKSLGDSGIFGAEPKSYSPVEGTEEYTTSSLKSSTVQLRLSIRRGLAWPIKWRREEDKLEPECEHD